MDNSAIELEIKRVHNLMRGCEHQANDLVDICKGDQKARSAAILLRSMQDELHVVGKSLLDSLGCPVPSEESLTVQPASGGTLK